MDLLGRLRVPLAVAHLRPSPRYRLFLCTIHDLRRLQTFLSVVGHPTFQASALSLGRRTTGITGHLQRLERDLRGQLLRRASKKQPMQLTALGQQVFEAALPLAQ
ncbi:LysR family transcriptional regulator [Streptomyces sp. NPDC006184]|uniref:LysR family transcriptional regulator n=1 Tax=Streptomyces sp. NPDC006184 TaxID=3155455 RepID=UPI0033B3821D